MAPSQPDIRSMSSVQSFSIRIRYIFDQITIGLNVLGTVLIVSLMVLVNVDVIGRSLFNAPVSGVPEIVSLSIVAIVFLQVGEAFRRGRLTRSEAILGFFEKRYPRGRSCAELFFCLCGLGVMSQLLSASIPLFVKSWVRNTFEGTIGDFTAPIWPVKLIILVGCITLMVQLALSAFDAWQGMMGKAPAGKKSKP